ncbi:uncharacterized protein LOC110024623 [Phalaenopsis equestris]|uniref:uncharacterized protein LOC110024623 n=1 Tax=Phalaenopsis equestris TaxID=78828 RepID=UPI0009E5D3E5|nr:uncharacterized protein LOC110024623 [Phalaenopsis equestris]
MSLLLTSMEVLNGPTVGLKETQVSIPVFSHGDYEETRLEIEHERKTEDFVLLGMKSLNTFTFVKEEEEPEKQEAEDSSESSSIGVQSSSSEEEDDDDDEERGNEVQSKLKEEGAFTSLDSLDDSLPIKRGLSNFFTGKSKSFASLSDASAGCAKDLRKQEHPFNKRRRILMANKISRSRRASYSSLITFVPSLLSPDHALKEGEEEEDDRGEENSSIAPLPKPFSHGLSKASKPPRSFSLSDLQHV